MNPRDTETLAEKILQKIRAHPSQYYNPTKLSEIMKSPGEDIVSAISLLRSWGYSIKADKNGHYGFFAAPDSFLSSEILQGLDTRILARKIYSFQTVQSTNAIASQLAMTKTAEGTLVIAEQQTRGRGRLGREWYSPKNVGLYCSIILYPKIHPTLAPGLSIMTAVALAETIAAYDDMEIKIKWPNDILISGLKVAGILTELSAEIDRVEYVIVGVGVNINQQRSDFPADLKTSATSVRIGAKEKVSRVQFLQRFLKNLEKEYVVFKKSGLREARKRFLKYSFLHSKEVKLKMGRKTIVGTVLDIDEYGRLVLDTREGIMSFNSGEVTTH